MPTIKLEKEQLHKLVQKLKQQVNTDTVFGQDISDTAKQSEAIKLILADKKRTTERELKEIESGIKKAKNAQDLEKLSIKIGMLEYLPLKQSIVGSLNSRDNKELSMLESLAKLKFKILMATYFKVHALDKKLPDLREKLTTQTHYFTRLESFLSNYKEMQAKAIDFDKNEARKNPILNAIITLHDQKKMTLEKRFFKIDKSRAAHDFEYTDRQFNYLMRQVAKVNAIKKYKEKMYLFANEYEQAKDAKAQADAVDKMQVAKEQLILDYNESEKVGKGMFGLFMNNLLRKIKPYPHSIAKIVDLKQMYPVDKKEPVAKLKK